MQRARSFRLALPLRARARERPVHMLQMHARRPLPRLPRAYPAPAPTCARHRHVRTRRLACFADGLRVAPPVQAAAAASSRARRSPRPRHLRHERQAQRRQLGHDDTAAVTPGAKPVSVVRQARLSSGLRPYRPTSRPAHPRVQRRRLRPDHRRHDRNTAAASSGHDPPPLHLSYRLWRRR